MPSLGTTAPSLISNSQYDTTWYYAEYVDPTHLQLYLCTGGVLASANYAGTPGSGYGWAASLNQLLANGSQPFFNTHANKAFRLAALTGAINAASYALSNATWTTSTGINYSTQSGYPTNGPYYARAFISCEPPSAAAPGCDAGIDGDRLQNGELVGVYTHAMILNPLQINTLRTTGDLLMAAVWACSASDPGYDGYCESAYFAPSGYLYSGSLTSKWFGFFWGVGGMSSYLAVRTGNAPGSVSPSKMISPSGSIAELREGTRITPRMVARIRFVH
jgi:hypothetical protein